MPEDREKRRLWELDPSMFERGQRASFLHRRVIPTLRQLGKFGLISLALIYPISIVYVGLSFGGLAFWTFLGGSIVVIWLAITRLGYASNFRNWDRGFKEMAGLGLGFIVAIGIYAGLFYFNTWVVLIAFGLAGLGFFFLLRRT